MKADKSRSKKLKTRIFPSCDGISNADLMDRATNFNDNKCSSLSVKTTADMKSGEDVENVGHKLTIHKPWFSHNLSTNNSVSLKNIPVSDSSVLKESVHVAVKSILDTSHIYDIYQHTEINQKTQESSSTDVPRESRMRPRVVVDKISKQFII